MKTRIKGTDRSNEKRVSSFSDFSCENLSC